MPEPRAIQHCLVDKIRIDAPENCWLWTGALDGAGYGHLRNKGRDHKAHRVAWELHNGPLPAEAHVLHRCDTPACTNPAHLFIGTHIDNMRDMAAKGRQVFQSHPEKIARGATHHSAVLTDAGALAIFHAEGSNPQIARHFGVGTTTVRRIKTGQSWGHVTGTNLARGAARG